MWGYLGAREIIPAFHQITTAHQPSYSINFLCFSRITNSIASNPNILKIWCNSFTKARANFYIQSNQLNAHLKRQKFATFDIHTRAPIFVFFLAPQDVLLSSCNCIFTRSQGPCIATADSSLSQLGDKTSTCKHQMLVHHTPSAGCINEVILLLLKVLLKGGPSGSTTLFAFHMCCWITSHPSTHSSRYEACDNTL